MSEFRMIKFKYGEAAKCAKYGSYANSFKVKKK